MRAVLVARSTIGGLRIARLVERATAEASRRYMYLRFQFTLARKQKAEYTYPQGIYCCCNPD
ncbi:MAG: hypothetical protein K2H96_10790 [Muribaculaceae bacterium]|nr:hypothetical protein [Muribaculaceae bacterium]MDE5888018.1 hypothetical protein [Muribaculaceae bacterium]